jgi:hypothetical protein
MLHQKWGRWWYYNYRLVIAISIMYFYGCVKLTLDNKWIHMCVTSISSFSYSYSYSYCIIIIIQCILQNVCSGLALGAYVFKYILYLIIVVAMNLTVTQLRIVLNHIQWAPQLAYQVCWFACMYVSI